MFWSSEVGTSSGVDSPDPVSPSLPWNRLGAPLGSPCFAVAVFRLPSPGGLGTSVDLARRRRRPETEVQQDGVLQELLGARTLLALC